MSLTGRRPNNRAQKIGRSLLDGLELLGTAMNDAPIRERISDIDKEVYDLLQERDRLITRLMEPGDLEVSENYDPRWTPSAARAGQPRLTECRGYWSESDKYNCHPACPYIGGAHRRHEFTLND